MSLNSCPATRHHWKEPVVVFFVPSLEVFIHFDEIHSKPSLLQAGQPQLSKTSSEQRYSTIKEWLFVGLYPICPCLPCTGEPSTWHRTPGVASPLLSKQERSPAANTPSHATQAVSLFCHSQLCSVWCPQVLVSKATSVPRALNSIEALKTIKAPVNTVISKCCLVCCVFFFSFPIYEESCFVFC